ncbi:DUF898 domain-containing protein [Ectothiorhodospiraceae bacterium 2226]|nr:DUF898 domain-containing protein [Ectothiorhodospiraceae bacterium 2226]
MTAAAYTLIFEGEILDGFEPSAVKVQAAKVFKLTPERLDEMFTLPRVVLKRGLSLEEATRFSQVLQRMGLVVQLEPGAAAKAAQAAAPLPATAPAAPTAPVTDAAVATPASDAARTVAFRFYGEGFEFFKIWIVNILLTIVTLGIYSAWAKVRTKRYFYGNTQLDGAAFEYLADPIRILKGRLIAFAFLVAYTLSDLVSPLLSFTFFLLFLALLPWVMVRALRFRNHYSAYRGVRFGFDGQWREAAKVFLLWPLLGLLTLGVLMPMAFHRQQHFIIGNGRYGNAPFEFSATVRGFYKVFLITIGVVVGGAIAAGIFSGILAAAGAAGLSVVMMPLLIMVAYLGAFVAFSVLMTNLRFNHTALAGHRLEANYAIGSYAKLMAVNTLGMILTLGLFYPWAKVRTARYASQHIRVHAAGNLDGFVATQHQEMSAVGSEVGDLFDIDIGF